MIDQIRAWAKAAFYTKREVEQRIDVNATALTTHAALTAAHGATGAVVGTTNTQTLTNKTLTAPAISDPVITGSTGAWTNLAFDTGWGDFGGGYQSGQYKKVGDFVFLRGLVARTSGTGASIATLPTGYRPGAFGLVGTLTDSGIGRLDIATTGVVSYVSGGTTWVQLDNLCFSVV